MTRKFIVGRKGIDRNVKRAYGISVWMNALIKEDLNNQTLKRLDDRTGLACDGFQYKAGIAVAKEIRDVVIRVSAEIITKYTLVPSEVPPLIYMLSNALSDKDFLDFFLLKKVEFDPTTVRPQSLVKTAIIAECFISELNNLLGTLPPQEGIKFPKKKKVKKERETKAEINARREEKKEQKRLEHEKNRLVKERKARVKLLLSQSGQRAKPKPKYLYFNNKSITLIINPDASAEMYYVDGKVSDELAEQLLDYINNYDVSYLATPSLEQAVNTFLQGK